MGPNGYLEHIHSAKNAVAIPVIASLNGVSTEGWIRYAQLIEEAGGDSRFLHKCLSHRVLSKQGGATQALRLSGLDVF